MSAFRFSTAALDPRALRGELADPTCGGYAAFEGWVRNHHEGQPVTRLEYEAYVPLAVREGERIVAEARERFGIHGALCAHRLGGLELGEIAVWVGVAAAHRDEAFRACRYIIDEVKHRLPIWKKEHYRNGDSGWVNCERCAAAGPESGQRASEPAHTHEHTRVPPP
jgi:molybdopterin synthase catalytic subunit